MPAGPCLRGCIVSRGQNSPAEKEVPSTEFAEMQKRGKFLHVVARSEATGQSVTPAVAQTEKQYFGRIRKSGYEFALSITDWQSFSAGKRIATPVCALVRNDMQKEEALLRLQGGFPAVHRQRPLANADARQIFACHCEERGSRPATWQSVLLAVGQNEKQSFGRIRKA